MAVVKAIMRTYYRDGACQEYPCEVNKTGSNLVVSYRADGDFIIYKGIEVEAGHFKLTAPAVNGRASLHRFADEVLFVGSWTEAGDIGTWEIELEDELQ